MAIQDERFDALMAQGFFGTNDDMMLQWAKAAGATSNHINDAVLEALLLNGATTPNLSDAWVEYLNSIGLTGTRNDMELGFWEAGGVIDPTPPVDKHWDRVQDKSDPTLFDDLNTLIDSLEATGVWDQLIDLSVIHTSAVDSLLGLKGLLDSTPVGNPFFSVGTGFVVGNDGANRYINTNIFSGQTVQATTQAVTQLAGHHIFIDDQFESRDHENEETGAIDISGFVYRFSASAVDSGALGSMGAEDDIENNFVLSNISAVLSEYTLSNGTVTAPAMVQRCSR